MLGVMVDCSRNAVMNVRAVKRLVDLLGLMGYDTLMLYTEDTYEVNNRPFFGYKRGRYSKEEIKEIDAYCISKGIELIPCIQTLAHLNCMFKWSNACRGMKDCDDILLIGEEKTYQLIRDMFSTVSECFSSKRIHIGMDEAYRVGLGEYLKKHGYEERFDVINRHLHKVCEIAEEYGYLPMIWSDMFCKLAMGVDNYLGINHVEEIKNKAALPENVSLVYWNYYRKDYEIYANNLQINQNFDREVIFAGGAWTWKGFVPYNRFSIETTIPAMKACKDKGVDNILITMWGDDGGECSRFGVLPALFYTSQLVKGNRDEEDIKVKFKDTFGMDFDSFIQLEKMNYPGNGHVNKKDGPVSKYLFYNDPFLGLFDYTISGHENQYYKELKLEMDEIVVAEEYKSVFDYIKALCDVLAVKSELGVRTRTAYLEGNRKTLREIAEKDYNEAIEKVREFHVIYQNWWMSENKPQGFEMQDIRIGGLIQRLESCRDRLISYCEGHVDNIPELEEELLPDDCGDSWARIVTPGVISHVV